MRPSHFVVSAPGCDVQVIVGGQMNEILERALQKEDFVIGQLPLNQQGILQGCQLSCIAMCKVLQQGGRLRSHPCLPSEREGRQGDNAEKKQPA